MIHELLDGFGSEVPRDYCCIGLVTTGLGFGSSVHGTSAPGESDDVIVQLGYCGVTGSRVDAQKAWLLNWSEMGDVIDPMWLEMKLKAITEEMEVRGKVYPVTYDTVRRSKCYPIDGLQQFVDLLDEQTGAGKMLVGHNLLGFGLPVLADTTQEWLGSRFEVPSDCILDLGIIEKARQLNEYPMEGESLYDFLVRVSRMRGGGRWGMDHCCAEYGLVDKYPIGRNNPEDAAYKALTCHRLLHAMVAQLPTNH
jgi:hypothetical protein